MLVRHTRGLRRSLITLSPRSPLIYLKPPPIPPLRRWATTVSSDPPSTPSSEAQRHFASIYICNVFPIRIAWWDPRPTWATLREETIMERLHDIGTEMTSHAFEVESWEIARKDGGVFMHFSYVPPADHELQTKHDPTDASREIHPSSVLPGALFLDQLKSAANKHGGWPSWLGQWWADAFNRSSKQVPGHAIYEEHPRTLTVGEGEAETEVQASGSGIKGLQAVAGGGRVWVVKGKQWTEVR